jgi:3-oxoacyl-[acyl-carrier protein] reductase
MSNIVITGCNRGLGLSLLKGFAKKKHNIIACTRCKSEDFIDVCGQIEREEGIKIYPVYFELTDKEQILKGIELISALDIDIDVLINNAAIFIIKPQWSTEYEEVENSFKINYFAPFLITKMISNLMMRQGKGSIINITSIGSLGHQPGGACYDASKAALNQFTVSVAQELAPFNIRVNAIASGPMQTEMFTKMREDLQKKLSKSVALKRPASTEEITKVVMFMASEDSSYITGQILRVDGGAVI